MSAGPGGAALTGAELRLLTARVRAIKAGRGFGEVLTDLSYGALVAGLTGFYLWALVAQARVVLGAGDLAVTGLSPGLVQVVVPVFAAVAALGAALRLGPATMPAGGVRWWLPTPADRAGMLAPAVVRAVLLGLGGGLVVGALTGVLAGADAAGVLANAAFGASLGLLVVGAAGALQVRGSGRARAAARSAADLLLVVVPLLGVVAALVAPPFGAAVIPVAVPGALAVAGALAVVVWTRGLNRLRAADLRGWAADAEQLHAAALGNDAESLGRTWSGPVRVRRWFTGLTGLARGPASALLVADLLLLLRDPRGPLRLLAQLAAGVFLARIPLLADGLGLWCLALVVGLGAASALAPGAKEAGENQRLDRLLPLGARAVLLVRAVVPAAGAGAALAALSPTTASSAALLAALPATAAVLAAAAIRLAYRGPVPWNHPTVATPMGAVNLGQVMHSVKGPDLAVVCLLPLAAILVAGLNPVALVVQYAAAGVALAVAARGRGH